MTNIVKLREASSRFDLLENDALFPVRLMDMSVPGKTSSLDVPNHKAVVRADRDGSNPRTIGVVGSDYKLLKNSAYFGSVEDAIERNVGPDLLRGAYVNTSMSYDGGYTAREYVLPAFSEELRTSTNFQTNIGFRVIAWNSYNGYSSAGMACGLIDFFCTNGCISGAMVDMAKRRHTKNLEAGQFTLMLEGGLITARGEVDKLRKMASKTLDRDAAIKLFETKFSARRAKALTDQLDQEIETRGDNVFALHSALTYYASHNSEVFPIRDTGQDNVVYTLHNRQVEVARVMDSADFQKLAA